MGERPQFDARELARILHVQVLGGQPRLMVGRGPKAKETTFARIVAIYPEHRMDILMVVRQLMPAGYECTLNGVLRELPRKEKKSKQQQAKRAVKKVAAKTKQAAQTVKKAGRKAAGRVKHGVRPTEYQWRGSGEPAAASDPGLADRIRQSMQAYTSTTRELRAASAWDRKDIGYWD